MWLISFFPTTLAYMSTLTQASFDAIKAAAGKLPHAAAANFAVGKPSPARIEPERDALQEGPYSKTSYIYAHETMCEAAQKAFDLLEKGVEGGAPPDLVAAAAVRASMPLTSQGLQDYRADLARHTQLLKDQSENEAELIALCDSHMSRAEIMAVGDHADFATFQVAPRHCRAHLYYEMMRALFARDLTTNPLAQVRELLDAHQPLNSQLQFALPSYVKRLEVTLRALENPDVPGTIRIDELQSLLVMNWVDPAQNAFWGQFLFHYRKLHPTGHNAGYRTLVAELVAMACAEVQSAPVVVAAVPAAYSAVASPQPVQPASQAPAGSCTWCWKRKKKAFFHALQDCHGRQAHLAAKGQPQAKQHAAVADVQDVHSMHEVKEQRYRQKIIAAQDEYNEA